MFVPKMAMFSMLMRLCLGAMPGRECRFCRKVPKESWEQIVSEKGSKTC